jgi:hypothetical protein
VAAARFRILRHRSDGSLSWRLLATNNRDLGRAPIPYPDAEVCRAAVLWLQRNTFGLRIGIVRAGPSSWSWRILSGETVVAVSSRADRPDVHRAGRPAHRGLRQRALRLITAR